MTTSLITGANKGLGFETARQLVAAGHQVWIGARNSERGQQAARRQGQQGHGDAPSADHGRGIPAESSPRARTPQAGDGGARRL